MKKLFIPLVMICFGIVDIFPQTAGLLTFNVSLTSHQGRYGAGHVVAVWIADSTNTFVKTNLRMANSNHTINNHLNVWKSSSNLNTVDAVTGATLTSYSKPISISWNGTDVSGNTVKDGNYTIWIEETWDDGPSGTATASFIFKKGDSIVTLSPSNTANFTSMVLQWTPNVQTVIITNGQTEKSEISIYPNPANNLLHLTFYNLTGVKNITITDLQGKICYVQTIEKSLIGEKYINLQGIKVGTYILTIQNIDGTSLTNSKLIIKR
jgi:hypothetical protein